MADDENVEDSESGSKPKIDINAIKEKFKAIDWKDRKNQGAAAGLVVILLLVLYLMFGGAAEAQKKETTVDLDSLQRPVDYIMVFGADPKEVELRATIKDEDRVMQFSMSLGVEQKGLRLELQKRMSPITSEVLRFLSTKTKDEILEMIQDEDGKSKLKLLSKLNLVLKNAGEEKLDLKKSGRIVQINFTKYYFPTI